MKRSFPEQKEAENSHILPNEAKRSALVSSSFQVTPIDRFAKNCPFFRQPAEVGSFSLDGHRQFHHDRRQLRHYTPPSKKPFKFDLREGYTTCIQKDEDIKERLTHLLDWVNKNRKKFEASNEEKSGEKVSKGLNTDFISWRGHFTKLLCTPYEMRDPWKIAVSRFQGTIYLSEVETEKARFDRLNRDARQREMCYWGYKFEDYVTEPIKGECFQEAQDTNEAIVNTNEAFCSIVRTRLSSHSIVVGCEVDCCQKDHQGKPPSNYIELKTTRFMNTYKQNFNFSRYKLLKIWGQSFLAGVPKIVVGMRNDKGIVSELKSYETLNIPHVSKEYPNMWEPNVCINFLDSLLSWLKTLVTSDDANTVYMLDFDYPFEKITVKMTDDGSERFLPDWFVNQTG